MVSKKWINKLDKVGLKHVMFKALGLDPEVYEVEIYKGNIFLYAKVTNNSLNIVNFYLLEDYELWKSLDYNKESVYEKNVRDIISWKLIKDERRGKYFIWLERVLENTKNNFGKEYLIGLIRNHTGLSGKYLRTKLR